jgi:UDP-glucose 4-epimerase
VHVLVTGAGRYLGAHLAARLADHPRVERVVGFDTVAPTAELQELLDRQAVPFLTGDVRGVVAVVTGNSGSPLGRGHGGFDAVAHMGVQSSPSRGGRAAMKEHNIIGTMQLLAACQATARVHKLVVRSSTAAYGASFRDPAIFTESTAPTLVPRGGFAKDVIEIEGYVRGFTRRRPDVTTTVLRLAPFVGPDADTSLTRYFAMPVVPTVFGRDPRLQFIHVDDALELLVRAVVENHRGTYNVAGTGVLALSQAIRRAGRIGLPVVEPGMNAFATLVRASGLGRLIPPSLPRPPELTHDQLDLFVHGRVVDNRALVEEFGYRPRSTAEAFDDFIHGQGLHNSATKAALRPEAVATVETIVRDGIRAARTVALQRLTPGRRTHD